MTPNRLSFPGALALALASCVLAAPAPAGAQAFVDPQFSSDVIATLPQYTPVGIDWSPDGRLFILQKHGVVRIVKDGVLLPAPFLDISQKVNSAQDSGLLGIAFHPDFANNGYVYLAYVFEEGVDPNDTGPKTARVVRVRANPANPDVAMPESETIIMGAMTVPACLTAGPGADCLNVSSNIHTIGTLRFAPDGKLLIGSGDGSFTITAEESLRAQDLDSLNGKILRVNDDGTAPADNPFYDGNPHSNRSKVWAYGLRNPYRFVLHPVTGLPYVGDVGWNTWEELDIALRGGNLGWPCFEGVPRQPEYSDAFAQCAALQPSAVVPPFFAYGREVGSSVLVGAFYTGTAYPEMYRGSLFFADYPNEFIQRVVFDAAGNPSTYPLFASGLDGPVDLKQGPDGLLYYVEINSGQIRRIRFNGPTAVATATPTSGYSPLSVAFSSAGSTAPGGGTLSYLWNFGDGATSTEANPLHVYVAGSPTSFTARLTVSSGGLTSTATLKITVGSEPPNPVILTPEDGTTFVPGDVVTYQGTASDPDDGALPDSALRWTILLHHNTHTHTFIGSTGASGSFRTEYHGIGNYAYELLLTAVDSSGLARTVRRMVPLAPDTAPPTAPTGLTATALGREIRLSWTGSSDNYGVAGYRLERCQGAGCTTFALLASPSATAYTDSGLALSTAYSYRVRAVDAADNASGYSNVATSTTPDTAPVSSITGVRATPPAAVNLSAGSSDWVHWGALPPPSTNRKAGVTSQIGPMTIVGGEAPLAYSGHPVAFNWNDGTPTATSTTSAGIYVAGMGRGFRLTLPADPIRRTLTLYVGVWRAQGRLVASLSDGSAPDYIDTGLNNTTTTSAAVYTIEYQASTSNQTLTVSWTQANTAGGNVTLQAATLVQTTPDFTLSASPATQTVAPGGQVSFAIGVSPLNGFSDSVELAVTGLPPGATATFEPSMVAGGTGTSTLSVTAAAGTANGAWPLSITGTAGAVVRSTSATLDVQAPAFTVAATPASRTTAPGGSVAYTVTIAPTSGFAGDVALSATGLPPGTTGVFAPASITGGAGSSTFTVSTTGATPSGAWPLSVVGTSDDLTRSAGVSLTVENPDFSVIATPGSRAVNPGASTTYDVVVAGTGGFAGPVALSVEGLPAGATGTFAPATIAGGTGTSTLTVSIPAGAGVSASTLSIQGTNGALIRNAFVTLAVNVASLSGVVSTPTGTQSLPTLGISDWAHWGLTTAASYSHKAAVTPLIGNVAVVGGGNAERYTNHAFGFSWTGGTPTASATNTTTGLYVAGINRGFRITVPADTSPRTLVLFVGLWRSQGRLVAQLSDQSVPDYVDTSLLNASGSTAGRYALNYRAASAGQTLTVTYTQIAADGNVTLQAAALSASSPDYALGVTPASRTIDAGAATTYSVAVSPSNGFAGDVALGVTGLPAGATASFVPATILGGSGASTLTVTTTGATAPGPSSLTISGSSGALTRTVPATLVVQAPDFGISATPATRTVAAGSPVTYTVAIAPVNGFGGDVALSLAGLPAGATASFVPATITGGSGSSTLTVTTSAATPAGSPQLTVTGVSGTIARTATMTLIVQRPDFAVSATPASRSIAAGTSTTFSVAATPVDGFTGDVALSVTGLPAGASASFVPATITGGAGSSTLTITTTAATATGTASLAITGTSGALTRSAPATLTVSVASSGALSGAVGTPTGTQTLSTIGSSDWAHWGLSTATTFVHKAAITPLISNVTIVGGGSAQRYTNHPIGFSWTGGTPTASATNTTTGIYVAGVNRGFRITVPADQTPRTLTLFVGVYRTQGQLIAHLGDASAPDYVNSTLVNNNGTTIGRYTLDYRAATPGQQLTVTFLQSSNGNGNVSLQGAALSSAVADFGLGVTPGARIVTPGNATTYTIGLTPTGGFSGGVALSASGLPAGTTAVFSPAVISGAETSTLTVTTSTGTPAGTGSFTVTGVSGALSRTATPSLTVSTTGSGSITGTFGTPAGTQNLTALGSSDWAHWGFATATSYTHMASVTPQISNVTMLAGGSPERYTNHPIGFSWTGGTPTASATATTTGIFARGVNNGFQITVPADVTPRTLTIFLGVWRAQGQLVASLSDQSAPDFVDSSLVNTTSTSLGRYTLTFQSATPGQVLTVTFRQVSDSDGNVTLQAATLAGGSGASLSAAAGIAVSAQESAASQPVPTPVAAPAQVAGTEAIGYSSRGFLAK